MRDENDVHLAESAPVALRAEVHLALHQAGGSGEHLARALELVGELCSHLEGDDLSAFWRDVPLARTAAAARSVLERQPV